MQGGAGYLLMARTDCYFVDAAHRGAARLAETARHASQILQFKGDVFQDVAGPGAVLQPLDKTTAFAIAAAMLDQGWQPACQALVKAGQGIGREIFQFANVDPRLKS